MNERDPIPGMIYETACGKVQRLVVDVSMVQYDGSMAMVPRVEYLESNNGVLSMGVERVDIFAMAVSASSIIRTPEQEPKL